MGCGDQVGGVCFLVDYFVDDCYFFEYFVVVLGGVVIYGKVECGQFGC